MLNLEWDVIVWLVIAVILVLIEAATFNLVTIWFAIGALVALIFSISEFPLIFQIVSFIVVSGVLLYFTRPITKKYLIKKTSKTNADRLIGESGIVIEKIDAVIGKGQVKVMGQVWSARSEDNENIDVGEEIKVQDISGVKLIVKKIEKSGGN